MNVTVGPILLKRLLRAKIALPEHILKQNLLNATKCLIGTYSLKGITECKSCDAGIYYKKGLQNEYTQCPAGNY